MTYRHDAAGRIVFAAGSQGGSLRSDYDLNENITVQEYVRGRRRSR